MVFRAFLVNDIRVKMFSILCALYYSNKHGYEKLCFKKKVKKEGKLGVMLMAIVISQQNHQNRQSVGHWAVNQDRKNVLASSCPCMRWVVLMSLRQESSFPACPGLTGMQLQCTQWN